MISAKIEEVQCPKPLEFSETTQNGFTSYQIIQMEKHLLRSLQWFITPPALSTWANWYMTQWDCFV